MDTVTAVLIILAVLVAAYVLWEWRLEIAAGVAILGGNDHMSHLGTRAETLPVDTPIPGKPEIYTAAQFFPEGATVLREVYRSGKVVLPDGASQKLGCALSPVEGRHLYDIIRSHGWTRTLEVGMANGASTLFIAQALSETGGHHTAIDPNQSMQWKNAGVHQVERAGLSSRVELIQEDSGTALPQLLAGKKRFQFVLIDGFHTFDQTLVDFFFSARILDVGGVICVDDINHPGVADWLRYARANYPHMRFIPKTLASRTMATFVKVAEDTREWNFHRRFCGNGRHR